MNRSFTVESQNGLFPFLATNCHISQGFHPKKTVREGPKLEFKAMWDTGSTKTVITPRVVEALGLKPLKSIKSVLIHGVDGIEKSAAYEINLSLLSHITFHELTVVSKNPGDAWWDVLIGMDVISQGELSVKNVNSSTVWSFGIPSGA
jgi:predicted aspartyl protease